MDKLTGPILGISFILVIGMGLYAYTAHADLDKANAALATIEQNRNTFKAKVDEMTKKTASAAVALDGCNAQLRDAQAKLEAASKPAAARKK